MYKIMYGKMEVAQVQGKKEAQKALETYKKQNPNSNSMLWRMVK